MRERTAASLAAEAETPAPGFCISRHGNALRFAGNIPEGTIGAGVPMLKPLLPPERNTRFRESLYIQPS
ncbi:hypothetical protein [Brucella anthropi]|uniref:hypothetical protein n=1 Tax=Brucella anthropi TaxID=529 RepID=UPI003986607D